MSDVLIAHPTAVRIDSPFRTDHLMADLKGRSIRGGAVTLSAQALKFVLQLGSTAVLARLLTPADFGLVAMVAAFTGFVSLFKDLGLSMATVQRDQITHEQVSTLFWINVGLSVVLMGVAAALAPAVAWFYGEPRLSWIMLAVAGTFIFGGLSAQHTALLRRQMRFTALAVIEIGSMVTGIAVAILMAWRGLGYWSLVAMGASTAASTIVMSWICSRWRPGFPRLVPGVTSMLRFGGNLTATSVLQYCNRNVDNVLIGAVWGSTALGIYTKAYGLLLMPMQQINAPLSKVALPALSRLANDPEKFRRFYQRAIQSITLIGMPMVAFALVAAHELTLLVLGSQWTGAVPVFRALAPAAFIGTFNIAAGWVFISTGKTAEQLRAAFVSSALIVAAIALGLPYGAMGIAVAYSTALLVSYPFLLLYSYRNTSIRLNDFLASIGPSTVSSTFAAAATVLASTAIRANAVPATSVLWLAGTFVASYTIALIMMPSGRRAVSNVFDVCRYICPTTRGNGVPKEQ